MGKDRPFDRDLELRILAAQMVVNAGGSGFWLRHKLADREEAGALAAAVVVEAALIADWMSTGDKADAETLRTQIAASQEAEAAKAKQVGAP